MLNSLSLLTGSDIPFPQAKVIIHQPKLKEISYIGEDNFIRGCETLSFSKNILLSEEDKNALINKTDFEVFMIIMNDKTAVTKINRLAATLMLSLLFPNYSININSNGIALQQKDENEICYINNSNFEIFRNYIIDIFCLNDLIGDKTFNPAGERSRKIAEKLQKGRQKVASLKNEQTAAEISIFGRYISILAIGLEMSIDTLSNYTVYQLLDTFNRFELKQAYEMYFEAKIAGAKDLQEPDNWMKDIHSKSDDKII